MRTKIVIGLAAGIAATTVALGAAGNVSAAPSANGACVQAGIGTLKSLGLLQAAAQQKVNYALIDVDGPGIPSLGLPGGLINAQLGTEAFLSLGAVVKLHTTSPQLFAWC